MGLPSGSHDKVERGQGSSLSPGLPEQELEGAQCVLTVTGPLLNCGNPMQMEYLWYLRKLPGHVATQASSPCICWPSERFSLNRIVLEISLSSKRPLRNLSTGWHFLKCPLMPWLNGTQNITLSLFELPQAHNTEEACVLPHSLCHPMLAAGRGTKGYPYLKWRVKGKQPPPPPGSR